MSKKQPEALRLAKMLTADEWPGSVTLVSYARECVAELLRLHAENETLRASHGQAPAGAGEPFCWHWENTFNGGMGAMKKNPETLGINMSHPDYKWTALYTAPQPSPTAQAASSAVLKAIREANMQLVRTGDDAFMLVPYKVATAQSAESVPAKSYAELEKKHSDFVETAGLMLEAVGYTEDYARQWPKEKASITFKRWFDEQLATRPTPPAMDVGEDAELLPCPFCGTQPDVKLYTAQAAESVPAVSDLPPLPDPDLRDVGTKPQDVKDFLNGYATEYARLALAARAPAESVGRDAILPELFREALAWGMTYGPEIPAHQWDQMRESMVNQYVSRAAIDSAMAAHDFKGGQHGTDN